MALIRCTSCAYANTMDAKVCKRCGSELGVPPHLMRCPYCGSLNRLKATLCIRCDRKLSGSWRRRLRGSHARGVVATTVAVLAVLGYYGYYAYPRGLPQDAPRPPTVAPADSAPGTPVAKPPPAATDAPRADRVPGDTPRAKAAPVAAVREAGIARKADEPRVLGSERCDEGVAALGLCGKAEAHQPPRPQVCTEAVAALGLCEAKNLQGRE
jgi:hypothetical protein